MSIQSIDPYVPHSDPAMNTYSYATNGDGSTHWGLYGEPVSTPFGQALPFKISVETTYYIPLKNDVPEVRQRLLAIAEIAEESGPSFGPARGKVFYAMMGDGNEWAILNPSRVLLSRYAS